MNKVSYSFLFCCFQRLPTEGWNCVTPIRLSSCTSNVVCLELCVNSINRFTIERGERTNTTHAKRWSSTTNMRIFTCRPSFNYMCRLHHSLCIAANFVLSMQYFTSCTHTKADSTWQVDHALIYGKKWQDVHSIFFFFQFTHRYAFRGRLLFV